MEHKRTLIFTGLIIFVICFLGACSTNEKTKDEEDIFDPEPDPDAAQLTSYDKEPLEAQKATDKELAKEAEAEEYTFYDPLVKLDPYDRAPLSALLQFETEEPVQIEVTTGTGDDEVPIKKKQDDYKTKHEILVLGLYPDRVNKIILKAYDKDGNEKTSEVSIETDPIPDRIPNTELVSSKPADMADGLTFVTTSKSNQYAVDKNADVRWYSSMDTRLILSRLSNGHLLTNIRKDEEGPYQTLLEMDALGKVYNAYNITVDNYDDNNLIHHDVIELPNGHLLATVHDPDSDYVEDTMIEIDRESGETTQQIDLKNVLPDEDYEDYDGEYADDGDWFHQNAVWFDETDHSIIISGRHQDAIMKLSYPDAEVEWILGADEDWSSEQQDKLLEPVGNDFEFPAAQHAVKKLPNMDNNPDTEDIILFDNNHVVTRGNEDISDEYSRMVQYRINEKEKTVEEVWSYGEERGKDFYSSIVGNAQYLPDTGNRLITSGYIAPDPDGDARVSRIVETNDESDADVLYEIKLSGFNKDSHKFAYRAHRWPLYP